MHIGNKENYLNTGNAYKDIDGNIKQKWKYKPQLD